MGRQVSVLVTDEDLIQIEKALLARGDVAFLSDVAKGNSRKLMPLSTLVRGHNPARPAPGSVFCYLIPTHREPRVIVTRPSPVKVDVSVQESECIEFWRSNCTSKNMRRGRTYYTPRYFDGTRFIDKDPAFVKWAERVVATMKKSLNYDRGLLSHVGTDAARKIASGELKEIA